MELHIHLHHHYDDKLFTEIKSINEKTNKIMATIEQFESALNRIDTATTNIANELQSLKDQIANQGLPSDVEANVLARLDAAATKLEGIGKTPENPVPGEPGTGDNGGTTTPGGTDPNANL